MSVVASTIDAFILSIISEKHNELQIYFDTLVFQVGMPQYDLLPTSLVSSTQILHLYFAFRLVWPHLCYVVLLWMTRWLAQVPWLISWPTGFDQTHKVCTCAGVNPPIAQASAPLRPNASSSDVSIEPNTGEKMNGKPSPNHPSSPGRASKISTRPVQGEVLNVVSAESLSVCSFCGQPTSVAHNTKLLRGGAKPAVQNGAAAAHPGGQENTPVPTSSKNSAPLRRSLEQGSSNYPKPVNCDISTLNVLVVAKNEEEGYRPLKGPKFDADYISKELDGLPNVSVKSISDLDATLGQVEGAIGHLWKRADDLSHLIIFLTGHGDKHGMKLLENEHIDEQRIQERLQELNKEHPKDIRVVVVFDICRDELDSDKTVTSMDRHISFIWSCSIGQKARSLEFKLLKLQGILQTLKHVSHAWYLSWWHPREKHQLSPGSYFLLAVFKAYQDACEKKGSIEERLNVRCEQFARFQSYMSHTAVADDISECNICIRDKVWCSDAFTIDSEFKQDIDLNQYLHHLDQLFEFFQQQGYIASLPDVASRFFLRLDVFDERSKHNSQLSYLLRNPSDFKAWLGWLSWLIGFVCIYIRWAPTIQRLPQSHATETVRAESEKGRSCFIGQALTSGVADSSRVSTRITNPYELRGMNVSVVAALAPDSGQPCSPANL